MIPKSKNIIRAAFALYLVISLTFGDAGYWLFAVINLQAIKSEVSEILREHCSQRQLCEITFARNSSAAKECVWTEEGREFLYHNEMYDVVDSISTSTLMTYRCFKDTEETDFRWIVDRHANDDDIGTPSIRIVDLKICKDYTERTRVEGFFCAAEFQPAPFILHYQNPHSERNTPPPKFS